ncbi:hypothetical protein K438DRAFT_2002777 [Mycena galopus ATCC 62051]|nr:hypothetical protein K438DRAFT_2002777 [Mycena galopus ATCC 62051]
MLPQVVLPPIAYLPPEILADVFVRCVPTSIDEVHTDLSWLNILQVSTLWQSVALGCPEFWSTLIPSRPKSTSVFIARAKVAPLVIRADIEQMERVLPNLESVVLDNISQLGALEIRASQFPLTNFLYDLDGAAAAPRLRCCKIVNTTASALGLLLPRDLFRRSEDFKKAEIRSDFSLHLHGCFFPWDSAWYHDITHLHLENITSALQPTMAELLTIFVGSPGLETLSLIHCYPDTSAGFPVDLPHLSALTIRNDFDSTHPCILEYLLIPPYATLDISYDLETFRESDHMISSLISNFCRTSPTTYDTVRISHEDGFAYTLLDSARPWWSRRFRIDGKSCQPYHTLCAATRTLVTTLDFTAVTTLHLHSLQGVLPPNPH